MILLFPALVMMIACSGREKTASAAENVAPPQAPASVAQPATAPVLPPGHPPITPELAASVSPSPSQSAGRITGRVLETMNAGGYTYVRLASSAGEQWAAVNQASVKKGTTIAIDTQMVAEHFESKTLHRTFDKIVFGVLAGGNAGPAAPASVPTSSAMGSPAQHMSAPVADVNVEKAPGGRTVAEIWAARKELNDKPVVVRGKVVKFLSGIMGRNWLHVRDGSGSREKGNDDLTVTTMDTARVGDVVTVSGTVHIDQDFGAGYEYKVIVEGATLKN